MGLLASSYLLEAANVYKMKQVTAYLKQNKNIIINDNFGFTKFILRVFFFIRSKKIYENNYLDYLQRII